MKYCVGIIIVVEKRIPDVFLVTLYDRALKNPGIAVKAASNVIMIFITRELQSTL